MPSSRGDTKPCTAAECGGTMQFGRRRDNNPRTAVVRGPAEPGTLAMDVKGWVCNADPAHFRQQEE